ncbi:MAG TPA: DNA-3-methyladenine glycosylase I [Pirellulales bacterium]|jgi:DNA-3-methyladenine glycosylase I|nr:DNA-3-methyladenine glycosylase I [Pirellulales bacterium]
MPKPLRCPWPPLDDPLYVAYHDTEWGVPLHDDRKLFEFLVLEAFQAGLSWRCVLHKRENFRRAFAKFDYRQVARFTARDLQRLVNDAGIVRNRAKIKATVNNAQRFLEVREEFGTFAKYMWSWVEGRPIVNRFRKMKEVPAFDDVAARWSKDLKQRGFQFLGPTVVYAHMQAVGMVNDHTIDCFRHREVQKPARK